MTFFRIVLAVMIGSWCAWLFDPLPQWTNGIAWKLPLVPYFAWRRWRRVRAGLCAECGSADCALSSINRRK